MTKLETRDYFSDREMTVDPYPYYEALRAYGPVYHVADRNIMMVIGYEECRQVLMDEELYSAITASVGPATPIPFVPEGDDVTEQLEAHRPSMPNFDLVTSMDGQAHRNARSLLNKLFVPSRLRANEEYMTALAERMVDEIVARGHCDMIVDVATPFVTLVIADLLGVPADDRETFRAALAELPTVFSVDDPERKATGPNGYFEMAGHFHGYIVDRRANPQDDILTRLSAATYPDGSLPTPAELVKVMMILFGAGQDTSAKLLANATRRLCEQPELQDRLRADPSLIAPFLEEMMRTEGSTKITSRLATRRTTLGGVDIPAGQVLAVVIAAANRDPARYDDPDEFRIGRPKAMEHLGFGRGGHSCIGAPLARAEVRIFLDKMLARTRSFALSEAHHGPAGERRLKYEPSYGMRGLSELFVEFEPV